MKALGYFFLLILSISCTSKKSDTRKTEEADDLNPIERKLTASDKLIFIFPVNKIITDKPVSKTLTDKAEIVNISKLLKGSYKTDSCSSKNFESKILLFQSEQAIDSINYSLEESCSIFKLATSTNSTILKMSSPFREYLESLVQKENSKMFKK